MAAAQRQGGRGRGNLRAVDGEHRDVPPIVNGRVPPHDLDAEAAVLSAILLAQEALGRVQDIIKPEHFYSDANGRIFDAMIQVSIAGTPVDIVTVASYLRDRDRLAQVGGAPYLAQLADATPAFAHVEAHAQIVFEKWRLRALIATSQRVAAEGYGDVGDAQAFIDSAKQAVGELADVGIGQGEGTSIGEAVEIARARVDAIARGVSFGLLTGYTELDRLTGGFKAPEVTLLGAPPKTGKTTLARGITTNIASVRDQIGDRSVGRGVIWISLEMGPDEQALAWACTLARVDLKKLERGECGPAEYGKLAKAMRYLKSLPIEIFGRRNIRGGEIKRLMREAKTKLAKKGAEPRLVVIDHLQLLHKNEMRAVRDDRRNDAAVMGDITREIGDIAEWAKLPILLITQLTEDDKGRQKARGSRDIEADAQHFWILEVDDSKPAPSFPKGNSTSPVEATVTVKLSRSGPKGSVSMWFRPAYTEFSESAWSGREDDAWGEE